MKELNETIDQQIAGKFKKQCTDALADAWVDYTYIQDWDEYVSNVENSLSKYVKDYEDTFGGDEGSESRYKERIADSILDILYAAKEHGQQTVSRLMINNMLGQPEEKNLGSEWYVLEHEKGLISKKFIITTSKGSKITWNDLNIGYFLTPAGEKYVEFNNIYKG